MEGKLNGLFWWPSTERNVDKKDLLNSRHFNIKEIMLQQSLDVTLSPINLCKTIEMARNDGQMLR